MKASTRQRAGRYFQVNLDAARALLEKEGVTGQEIEAQTLRLNSAIEGLVSKADKTALQAAYDSAAALTNDGAYPGWDTLQTVLASAKAVLEDVDASQAEVDEQLNALNMAVENLSGSVDKSVLKDLIAQAKALDTSGYTESSVAFFEAAIASGTVSHERCEHFPGGCGQANPASGTECGSPHPKGPGKYRL